MIPDQKKLWNNKHDEGDHENFRYEPSPFAKLANGYLPAESKILELGCGVGRDAVYFVGQGHSVVATDFSDVVLQRNREVYAESGVEFEVLDMTGPFPYEVGGFDAVYANLSLHYYSNQKTRAIIDEITRVLKPEGLLAFACKSVNDPNYGNGEEIENNFFISSKGHARHLFSMEYAKDILRDDYKVLHLDEVEEVYSGQKSGIVQCIARKRRVA